MIMGLQFWGSPVQPEFLNWAFNKKRGAEIKRYWDRIPAGIDVLVTHGPPQGILDKTEEGLLVGCEELIGAVHRVHPKVHIFGHIHEGYGHMRQDGILFVNASIMTERYQPLNKPITVYMHDGEFLVSDDSTAAARPT
jgi:Icc-related predicted phosphoesterase